MEFVGPGLTAMSIDYRLTLCNQSANAGAEAAIADPDQKTVEYAKARAKEPFEAIRSDADAEYKEEDEGKK